MDLSVLNVKLLPWLRAEPCLCSCEDRLNVRAQYVWRTSFQAEDNIMLRKLATEFASKLPEEEFSLVFAGYWRSPHMPAESAGMGSQIQGGSMFILKLLFRRHAFGTVTNGHIATLNILYIELILRFKRMELATWAKK